MKLGNCDGLDRKKGKKNKYEKKVFFVFDSLSKIYIQENKIIILMTLYLHCLFLKKRCLTISTKCKCNDP